MHSSHNRAKCTMASCQQHNHIPILLHISPTTAAPAASCANIDVMHPRIIAALAGCHLIHWRPLESQICVFSSDRQIFTKLHRSSSRTQLWSLPLCHRTPLSNRRRGYYTINTTGSHHFSADMGVLWGELCTFFVHTNNSYVHPKLIRISNFYLLTCHQNCGAREDTSTQQSLKSWSAGLTRNMPVGGGAAPEIWPGRIK